MPIEYIGVKCFNEPECGLFQVVQRRKDNKWVCRVCNKKQSIQKIYAQSYKAADIRGVIQQYNTERGTKLETAPPIKRQIPPLEDDISLEDAFNDYSGMRPSPKEESTKTAPPSKWAKYLDAEELEDENQEDEDDGVRFVTSLPEKSKRGTSNSRGTNSRGRGRGRVASSSTDYGLDDFYDESVDEPSTAFKSKKSVKRKAAELDHFDEDEDNDGIVGFTNNNKAKSTNSTNYDNNFSGFANNNKKFNITTHNIQKVDSFQSKTLQSNFNATKSVSGGVHAHSAPVNNVNSSSVLPKQKQTQNVQQSSSKWAKYVDEDDGNDDGGDEEEDGFVTTLDSNYELHDDEEIL